MKYQPVGNSDRFECNVSHNQAMDKATQEYHKFEVRTLSPVEQEYLRTIQLLNKKAKDKNREKPTK